LVLPVINCHALKQKPPRSWRTPQRLRIGTFWKLLNMAPSGGRRE